ncbi:hypothetical protein ACI8AA_04855 [Geodermatophilus sp. SYSU D01180]
MSDPTVRRSLSVHRVETSLDTGGAPPAVTDVPDATEGRAGRSGTTAGRRQRTLHRVLRGA